MPDSPFHPGELAVQTRTGESRTAIRNGQIIGNHIPEGARRFVDRQPMLIASSVDTAGNIWTSLLAGKPGFITTESAEQIRLTMDRLVSVHDDIF